MEFRFSFSFMQTLRLAYAAEFLIAIVAVFALWSQVGGQGHLDIMPWHLKLVLGTGAAFAIVRATSAAVEGKNAWNVRTLRWLGVLILVLVGCGLSTYYVHVYGETDEDDEDQQEEPTALPASAVVPLGLLLPQSRRRIEPGGAASSKPAGYGG
jgi:hypothetical protein